MSNLIIVLFAALVISAANAIVWPPPLENSPTPAEDTFESTVLQVKQKLDEIEDLYAEISIDFLANVTKIRTEVKANITSFKQNLREKLNTQISGVYFVNISPCSEYFDNLMKTCDSEVTVANLNTCIRQASALKFQFINTTRDMFRTEKLRLKTVSDRIQHCIVAMKDVGSDVETKCAMAEKTNGQWISQKFLQDLGEKFKKFNLFPAILETYLNVCVETTALKKFYDQCRKVSDASVKCVGSQLPSTTT